MIKLVCLVKTVERTLFSRWFWAGVEVSGHDFIERDDGALECELCGKVSR